MPNPPTVRVRLSRLVAMIDADACTGCGACVEVCPVDCITTIHPDPAAPGLMAFCAIDRDRCIGCKLCVRLPTRRSDPYRLLVCPWEAIRMAPREEARGAGTGNGPPGVLSW